MFFLHILALIKKEFLTLFKDPKSRFVVIGPPIIQLIVFGYACTYDLKNANIVILNHDKGHLSRELIDRFKNSDVFRVIKEVDDEREITPLIDSKDALMALNIHSDFTKNLLNGESAPLQVIIDGRNSNTAATALNYTRTIVKGFIAKWLDKKDIKLPMNLEIRPWHNPNLDSQWFMVTGLVGQLTLVVTIMVTALTIARERETGTFDQLLVTPLRPVEILIGKAVPGLLIGLFEGSFIVFLAVFWFKIPLEGHLWTLYLGLLFYLMAVIGVGLTISSLAVTQQQALMGAFIFIVPSVVLSGFTTPIANMPQIMQDISILNPVRHFMVILRGVFLEGSELEVLLPSLWPMLFLGVTNLCIATWLFKRRIY
jgi:ABC-2 type transport system permease protein